MKASKDQAQQELNDQAWIGDAVLALFARRWILQQEAAGKKLGEHKVEAFRHLTSNQFLSTIGRPTEVEAAIGIIYQDQGEAAAFDFIEGNILPQFLKQRRNRQRQ